MEATVIYSIAAFYKWVLIYSFKVSSEEPPRRDWRPSLKGQALLNLVMCSGSCCPQSPMKQKHYNFFVATEGGQPVRLHFSHLSPDASSHLSLCPLLTLIQDFQSSWSLKDTSPAGISLFIMGSFMLTFPEEASPAMGSFPRWWAHIWLHQVTALTQTG